MNSNPKSSNQVLPQSKSPTSSANVLRNQNENGVGCAQGAPIEEGEGQVSRVSAGKPPSASGIIMVQDQSESGNVRWRGAPADQFRAGEVVKGAFGSTDAADLWSSQDREEDERRDAGKQRDLSKQNLVNYNAVSARGRRPPQSTLLYHQYKMDGQQASSTPYSQGRQRKNNNVRGRLNILSPGENDMVENLTLPNNNRTFEYGNFGDEKMFSNQQQHMMISSYMYDHQDSFNPFGSPLNNERHGQSYNAYSEAANEAMMMAQASDWQQNGYNSQYRYEAQQQPMSVAYYPPQSRQSRLTRKIPSGCSFSKSSSVSDGENRDDGSHSSYRGQSSKLTQQLNYMPDQIDNKQRKIQEGISEQNIINNDEFHGRMSQNKSRDQHSVRKNSGYNNSDNFSKQQDRYEKPDEFQQLQFKQGTSRTDDYQEVPVLAARKINQQQVPNIDNFSHHDADLDGYNDYGATNFSRTDKKLINGITKKNSMKNGGGLKVTGEKLLDKQMYKTQQVWPSQAIEQPLFLNIHQNQNQKELDNFPELDLHQLPNVASPNHLLHYQDSENPRLSNQQSPNSDINTYTTAIASKKVNVKQRLATKRNTMSFGIQSTRSELVKKMPVSSKSPTGVSRQKQHGNEFPGDEIIQNGNHYVEVFHDRKQSKTVMGGECGTQSNNLSKKRMSDAILVQNNSSHYSLTNSNKQLKQGNTTAFNVKSNDLYYDQDEMVAKLKQKCTAMSAIRGQGAAQQLSSIPIIEQTKRGSLNKMKTLSNTIKQKVSPLRANSKLDTSHADTTKTVQAAPPNYKQYFYTNKPSNVKGSPLSRASPHQSQSPPTEHLTATSRAAESSRKSYKTSGRHSDTQRLKVPESHMAAATVRRRQTDEERDQKISPYKLLMFGEKDMYYKKDKQQAIGRRKGQDAARKSIGVKNSDGSNLGPEGSSLVNGGQSKNITGNSSRDQINRQSNAFQEDGYFSDKEKQVKQQHMQENENELDNDQLDDFMKFDQQKDFQVGEGLSSRQNGSRNAQVYEINQFNNNGIIDTDDKFTDGQFVTQPKNLFDTESNARTESKDGSGIKSRPQIKISELQRISSQENTNGLINMEPDREFKLIAWDEQNERTNNLYQKYRPKTQRYYQSVDSNFHIISEQDEAFEGHHMKRSDDTVSEKNFVSKIQSNSNAGGIQNTPESNARDDNIHHRMEVKKYVDSFLENDNECSGANSSQNVNLLSSKMISNNNCTTYNEAIVIQQEFDSQNDEQRQQNVSPADQEQQVSAKKTRNMNQSIPVKKAYNISKEHGGSTNEIITNGDNDQVLITLNSKYLQSGHLTMQSSIKQPSVPQSITNSVPQSQVVSRKPSHSDMHISQNQGTNAMLPFESPKEVHKIVFSNNIKMGMLEPSCIEEFEESKEQTKLHSAEPELMSEHEKSPRLISRTKKSDESSGGGTLGNSQQNKSQLFGKDTEIRESLCSIPEEYPSQNDDVYNESEMCEPKITLSRDQDPEGDDEKQDDRQRDSQINAFDVNDDQGQQQVFVSDHLLKPLNQNDEYGKCLDDVQINMKYPTPEDRDLVLQTKCTTGQKSKSEINNNGMDSVVTCSFKMDTEKQQMLSFTENKESKQPKTSPQPRKLAKQTSLKTFHTFDPEGNKMRFQNLSKSADSNFSNIESQAINLNDIMHENRDEQQHIQNGSMDDIPGENSVADGQQQQQTEEIRIMTQEEYFQMKKEQLEDIYLGTEIIYEEDMENHEFSTLQTCQSAQRLILPNQFNNMNFDGNTTQSLSPKKRSSKGMMSPDSRKSWQITNSLEKQAISAINTSQKFESNTLKDNLCNSNTAKRINNLRKKYSIDAQQDSVNQGQLEGNVVQKLPSYLKLQKPTLISNQPIVALNQNNQQYIMQNQIGAFVPSTNLRRKTQSQMQQMDIQKHSKVQPLPASIEPSKRQENNQHGSQISQKQKQRSISPLNILMTPQSMHASTPSNQNQHQQIQFNNTFQSPNQQQHNLNPPKSARSTSKAFQNQFKPKARNTSVSKQSITPAPGVTTSGPPAGSSRSPHQRPYTSNGVIKHGVNTRPCLTAREKSPMGAPVTTSVHQQIPLNLSPNGSRQNVNSKSNQQLKKGDAVVLQQQLAEKKNEIGVDQIYYNQTSSLSQLQQYQNMQAEKIGGQKHKKQLTQHEAYCTVLDSGIPSGKIINQNQTKQGQSEQHQLSWKKFMQHKKSQQHAQSHLLLNSSSNKVNNSQISQNQPNSLHLEKMSSQKLCNANKGEIKTGQIDLIDSENGSVKSLDKVNERLNSKTRRGKSEGKYSQKDQQVKSIYNRLESEIHDETLAAGSGISFADNRLDEVSCSKEGNLPRMASYSTHNQASVKVNTGTSPPNIVDPAIYNSPPKLDTPNYQEQPIYSLGQQQQSQQQQQQSIEMVQNPNQKPLVPKLKLSKVQLHRGVPKPLLTPVPKQKTAPTFSLKQVVTQKQTTARNNVTPQNQMTDRASHGPHTGTDNSTDFKKKMMIQQQLSLPHVQANKKNMMKAAARERKWVQGTMLKKNDKKKQGKIAVNNTTIPGETTSSGLGTDLVTRHVNGNNLVSFGVTVNQMMTGSGNGAPQVNSGIKTKQCTKRQVVIDLQADDESPESARKFSKRLSIPVKHSANIDITQDLTCPSKLQSSPNPEPMPENTNAFQAMSNKQDKQSARQQTKKRRNDPQVLQIETEFDDKLQLEQEQQSQKRKSIRKTSHKIEAEDKTSQQIEPKSTGQDQRKISTADEFKKNHIMKASPLQQIKFMGKNLADIGELLLSSSRQPIFVQKSGGGPKGSTEDSNKRGSPPRPSQFQTNAPGHNQYPNHQNNKMYNIADQSGKNQMHPNFQRQHAQSEQPANEIPVVPMVGGPHDLIILSTNSEQRVHSRQSYITPNKKNSCSKDSNLQKPQQNLTSQF